MAFPGSVLTFTDPVVPAWNQRSGWMLSREAPEPTPEVLANDHRPSDQPALTLDQVHQVDSGCERPRCAYRDHVAARAQTAHFAPAHLAPAHVVDHERRRPG